MKIGFIGSGYVGLVSGVMLASLGHKITCIDNDLSKVIKLSNGEVPFYEPGLDVCLKDAINKENIVFSSDYALLGDCKAVFICVGTPSKSNGEADLSAVEQAIINVAGIVKKDCLIIIKSTVPPGTNNLMINRLKDNGITINLASNPEFLREGAAINDFSNPDRIVFGSNSISDLEILREIYNKFIKEKVSIVETDPTTAEMIKYASNSFLAVKIAFINEMANLCEKIGSDVKQLSLGMGLDPRIGALFLNPGPGFGGSCFPKDTDALANIAEKYKCPISILNAAIISNKDRYEFLFNRIIETTSGVSNKKIAILGASFKANTDDIRSSPSIEIIKKLVDSKADVHVYDPKALDNLMKLGLTITTHNNIESCVHSSEAIIILTEWDEFSNINWKAISELVKRKNLIDYRNIADEKEVLLAGFNYSCIGKK